MVYSVYSKANNYFRFFVFLAFLTVRFFVAGFFAFTVLFTVFLTFFTVFFADFLVFFFVGIYPHHLSEMQLITSAIYKQYAQI
ncbi:MAG: hypothetical protein US54_C0016G0011 [Candidatus Roizmanbacteria bacterium GW2011_GWA2_37_7]|uniref:Uncharacterized protein n=1 Tax=Candidatus Roizmanbacteria bacterium GW2011_GWA2_37_7 TaxID=1618481 RepID=A0A0G0HI25_9BACT|nr:MAG: hypothetical protein US54_C0016G0011 [Candidatus Roizmanbacteria bacterium GW2011_GWA2_37_7]